MVDGNLNFMQGYAVKDSAGNIIRIIEYITGRPLPILYWNSAAATKTIFIIISPPCWMNT